MSKLEKFECHDCGCYFMVKSRSSFACPNCDDKVSFVATSELGGSYTLKAASIDEARHWVINHLDCSYEWHVKEL